MPTFHYVVLAPMCHFLTVGVSLTCSNETLQWNLNIGFFLEENHFKEFFKEVAELYSLICFFRKAGGIFILCFFPFVSIMKRLVASISTRTQGQNRKLPILTNISQGTQCLDGTLMGTHLGTIVASTHPYMHARMHAHAMHWFKPRRFKQKARVVWGSVL